MKRNYEKSGIIIEDFNSEKVFGTPEMLREMQVKSEKEPYCIKTCEFSPFANTIAELSQVNSSPVYWD